MGLWKYGNISQEYCLQHQHNDVHFLIPKIKTIHHIRKPLKISGETKLLQARNIQDEHKGMIATTEQSAEFEEEMKCRQHSPGLLDK